MHTHKHNFVSYIDGSHCKGQRTEIVSLAPLEHNLVSKVYAVCKETLQQVCRAQLTKCMPCIA